uniref:Demeter RRM-fold domain-containing protein n=1 Tax=Solanum lycopersicum TaxID=4081 RepID=K4BRK6_SOLLC
MKRQTPKVSTTEGKAASLCVHKKPRLQASSSKNGLIVKHKRILKSITRRKMHKFQTMKHLVTKKMILRTNVILDEEAIQEWKSLIGKPEHEGCKSEKCDERWGVERTLFHGRVLLFISRMHLIQGGKKKKETRNQQPEPMLRWKSQNADMESDAITRENMRKLSSFVNPEEINDSTLDAINWHAVHDATTDQVSKAINQRGMDKKLAERIKVNNVWLRIPCARLPLTGPGENSCANVNTALVPVDSAYSCTESSQENLVSSFGEASKSQHSTGDHQNKLITYPALGCIGEIDIEDYSASGIPTITFDCQAFMENLLSYIDEYDLSTKDTDLSNALVVATLEAPLPKLKHNGRLRMEHQVYELPDSHPLLEGLQKRELEDTCPYALAIRTPDEESTQKPIEVPRASIWNFPRKTLYGGTSIRGIFRGMSTKEVQNCFWRGYVCPRGFNHET